MGQYDLPAKKKRIELKGPTTPVVPARPVEISAAQVTPEAVRKAFLKTLAKGEAPEGAYDYIIGGQRAKDLSQHPNVVGSAGKYGSSTAAGQYQFLKSTWDEQAGKYGYKDFKPETQDTAAWNYARDVYKQKTGRPLEDDLMSANPAVLNNISKVLGPTWTSLPGGPQPNSNWRGQNFADVYTQNLNGIDPATLAAMKDTTAVASADKAVSPMDDPAGNTQGGTVSTTASADTTTSDTATSKDTEPVEKKKKDYKEIAGDSISDIGKLYADGPVAKNARTPSGPANVAAAQLPMPSAPQPMIDAKHAEMQRQQLALAMQRLNSGKLV
jgi:muramidase (phage lysozyme)